MVSGPGRGARSYFSGLAQGGPAGAITGNLSERDREAGAPQACWDAAPTTLYAARGRLIPFNSNSPTGSTFTAFSTFINTRGLMRICPGFASSHSREATLDTVPIALEGDGAE